MQNVKKYVKTCSQAAALLAVATYGSSLSAAEPAVSPLTTIHSMAGSSATDGVVPDGTLQIDKNGALYGATQGGGVWAAGTVVQLTPPATAGAAWTEAVLYSFTGGADGGTPFGGLLFDAAGNIYGAAQTGGSTGNGVIFELSPPATAGAAWTESVVYSFTGGPDGGHPNGSLIFDKNGVIYGTASSGGLVVAGGPCTGDGTDVPTGCGVVFALTPPATSGAPWTESVLYSFTAGADGGAPAAGLLFDGKGTLYGTAYYGGVVNAACPSATIGAPAGCGVVFQLSGSGSTWTESVLYSFTGGTDGSNPAAPLTFDKSGALYSTTAYHGGTLDGGTLFQLTPPTVSGGIWSFAVLLSFGKSHGAHSYGGLIVRGTSLFGTAYSSGKSGQGVVFKLAPPAKAGNPWTQTVLYSFKGKTDGGNPFGGLVVGSKTLFGTTSTGGTAAGGTVFSIKP